MSLGCFILKVRTLVLWGVVVMFSSALGKWRHLGFCNTFKEWGSQGATVESALNKSLTSIYGSPERCHQLGSILLATFNIWPQALLPSCTVSQGSHHNLSPKLPGQHSQSSDPYHSATLSTQGSVVLFTVSCPQLQLEQLQCLLLWTAPPKTNQNKHHLLPKHHQMAWSYSPIH